MNIANMFHDGVRLPHAERDGVIAPVKIYKGDGITLRRIISSRSLAKRKVRACKHSYFACRTCAHQRLWIKS